MRRLVVVALLCLACKSNAKIRKDAPEGVTSVPVDAARHPDVPTSDPTPVSPPLVPLADCKNVMTGFKAWSRLQAAYPALLPRGQREGWDNDRYEKEIIEHVNAEAAATNPGGGTTGGVARGVPVAHTSPCRCEAADVEPVCRDYANRGFPAILCEVTRAHEQRHVEQCLANRALPAGSPKKYACNGNKSEMTLAQRAAWEVEAYDLLLRMLSEWLAAKRCPLPSIPADACKLVSEAEAASALGRTLKSTELTSLGAYSTCTYYGADEAATATSFSGIKASSVAVSVMQSRVTREVFEKQIIPGNVAGTGQVAKPLPHLGEAAYSIGADERTGTVIAFQNGVVVTVIVWIQAGAQRNLTDEAALLAMIAFSRM